MIKTNTRGYKVIDVRYIYNIYKKEKQNSVDYKTFRRVLEFIFSRIWHYMITETWVYRPPLNFGEFYICEVISSDGFYKNWKLTNKKGSLVKDYNLHSRGIKFFIKWNKRLAKVKHQSGYKFVPFRGGVFGDTFVGKRGLSAWIKKCGEDPTVKDYRAHIL